MWDLMSPYFYVEPIPFMETIIFSVLSAIVLVHLVAYGWSMICEKITSSIQATRSEIVTAITGPKLETTSLMDRIKNSKYGVASILYTLSQVRTLPLVLSQFVTLGSLLDLPSMAIESITARFLGVGTDAASTLQPEELEVVEHGVEEMLPTIAMVASLTGCKVGSINLDSFMSKMASNQRNAETLWKSIKPLLTQLGILKDSQYETIIEISRTVEKLMEEEAWLKLKIRTNTMDLLTGEGQARVSRIRQTVLTQSRRMNTITTKDLLTDKGVVDCSRRIKVLEDLLQQVDQAQSTCEFRVKPVGVCIWGEKQVGKTTMFQDLRATIMDELVKSGNLAFTDARSWQTWSRQCRDEYDTNYRGQQITYSDDAFQQKDNKDHLLWYSFISGTMVGTNQADLVNKGMPYVSKLVITTCNHLPKTSVTVSDISALHARFPFTIRVVKTGNVPSGSRHDPSYSWLDFYCGPMDLMINFEPPREGVPLPERIKKVTLSELAKMIANRMITEEELFRSRLPGYVMPPVVEEQVEVHTELVFGYEKLANWMAPEAEQVFASEGNNTYRYTIPSTPRWIGLCEMMSNPGVNLERLYTEDPRLEKILGDDCAVNRVKDYIDSNRISFAAYDMLRKFYRKRQSSMQELEDYFESQLGDIEAIGNMDTDLRKKEMMDFMIYKIVAYQCPANCNPSDWTAVCSWTKHLEHKRTGQHFLEWANEQLPSVTDFISTLKEWRVKEGEEEEFKTSYTHQLPLVLQGDRCHWVWSPLFDGGRVLLPLEELMAISRDVTRIIGVKTLQYYHIDFWLQGGFNVTEEKHSKFARLMRHGFPLESSDLFLSKFESLYYACRSHEGRERNIANRMLQEKISRIEKAQIDARPWYWEIQETYRDVKAKNKRIFESGMDRLIILFDSLGLPVNDYWRTVMTENAQLISYSVIALITSTILYGLIRAVQIRHAEEHSVSEKQPGKRKIQKRDVRKLIKTIQAEEHQGASTFKNTSQLEDLKIDAELLFERIEIGRDDYNSFEVIGIGNYEGGQAWGNLEHEFSPRYVNNSLVQECKVTRTREEGSYFVTVSIKERMKLDEYEKQIQRYIDTCKRIPIGEWTFDLLFTTLDDEYCYVELEYVILNANLTGKPEPWTRAQLKNLDDLQSALCKGDTTPIKNIIMGEEHGNDQSLLEVANKVLDHNLVSLEVARDENIELPSISRCLALASGDKIVLPAHVAIKGNLYKFTLNSSNLNTGYYVAKLKFFDSVRDVAIATIVDYPYVSQYLSERGLRPPVLTMFREKRRFSDISRLCLTETEMSDAFNGCDTLHYFHRNRRYLTGRTVGCVRQEFLVSDTPKEKKMIEIVPKFQSELTLSLPGDCGGPVFLASGTKKGALLGFYVQRSKERWYSAYICRNELMSEAVEHSFVDPWSKLIVNGPPRDLPDGPELKYIGLLRQSTLPATKTSLDHWKKSPFSAEFEEQLAPGRLNAYDPAIEVDLPVNQVGMKSLLMGPNSVMGKTLPELDQELLDWCVTQVTEEMMLTFQSNGYLKRVSDDIPQMLEYALNGAEDNHYVTGMEVRKASGLPWSLIGWQRKLDMIDIDPETGRRSFKKDEAGAALRKRVTLKLEEANKGNRILSFSNSKLKDQCIKLAHVRSGRTRVFHCVPVDSIIFCAALYGPFKEAYTRSRLSCYHAVGIDPKSRDWEELVGYLAQHPNFFDADYSNYDKHLHRQMMFAVRRIQRNVINGLVPDKWDKAREVEELDSIDTYVVDYATVYQTNRANKSGCYLTTVDNCIANDVYGLYAWVKATNIKSLTEYRQNVCTVAFGDDIVKSVSDKYKDTYNYLTYKKILEEVGHVITPGNKDGKEVATVSIDQLQFLKRGFDMIKGYWVAPLLKRSIEGPFVWTTIENSSYGEWKNLIQEQLYEAALHGKQYYNEFRDKLKKCTDPGLRSYIQILLHDTWDNTVNKLFERYDK